MPPQITVLRLGNSGPGVRALHEALAALGYQVAEADVHASLFGEPTRDVVARLQLDHGLPATGAFDQATVRVLKRLLRESTAAPPRGRPLSPATEIPRVTGDGGAQPVEPRANGSSPDGAAEYLIEGTVRSSRQPITAGLTVVILDRAIGGDQPIARTVTDRRGNYRVTVPAGALPAGKDAPDFQAQVFSGKVLAGNSEIAYNAGPHVRLDVDLSTTAGSIPSEYASLVGGLQRHTAVPLRELQESDQRQDITYLANKAGWDARMIAFAALADRLSQPTPAPAEGLATPEAGINPAFYYALFRAGVATDEAALFRTDLGSVQQIWKQALEQNVVPRELAREIKPALQAFQRQAVGRALGARVFEGAATLGELLTVSLGDDAAKKQRFAELATEAGANVDGLWKKVRAEFGQAAEERLRLDGELAVIADGSVDLLRKLHKVDGQPLAATGDLARRGYYRADRWLPLIDGGAVPNGTPGTTPEEKRNNYATALAAQVRLRYPTLAVAEMVKSGETPLGADSALRAKVHGFLTDPKGEFDLARQPIARYVKQKQLEAKVPPEVIGQVQRLQRVYQITPGDEAMNGLLKRGVDSAYAIARYQEADFVRDFAKDLGGEDQARLTHAKSREVHHAVLNVATTYVTSRRAVPIGVHSPPQIVGPTPEPPGASDITVYAKLEELVGSMDYCACEHCRSVLSPAAYLVDLLYFLENSASGAVKPLDVLFGRRPDLQYLPLTCENTNTALPYIDVVNEILECFVAHNLQLTQTDANGAVVPYHGRSTDDTVTTAELLASPQFVTEAAYDTLAQAYFPPPLPFNRPLEAMRRHFAKLEVPLEDAMEILRPNDQLGPGPGTSYGWYDILLERLQLSREERRLLVDDTLTLPQRFGFAAGTADPAMLAELSKVKGFCRRMGIGYDDLFAILGTEFVNPGSTLIPRLNRLGVSFENLKKFKAGGLTDAEFDALVSPEADAAEYGGDIKAWVKDNDNFTRIMGLITIRNPAHPADPCAVEELELRYADPDDATNKVRPPDFVRLARFIRLWKKLGWTVPQVDEAIAALRPTGAAAAAPGAVFETLLPRLGVVRQLLDRLQLKPARDLSRLLAFWAPIGTHGAASLYRQMFLRATGLRADAAFADDGYGDFLSDPNQTVAGHGETLRAAFNLTGEELAQILSDLGFNPTTPLTLPNVSLVFRWGWLARTLKLSVRELRLLSDMTGLDPFAPIDPPDPPVMRLLRLVEALRAVSLKPVQALYLIWNQDLSGKSAPAERDITGLARTLRSGLIAVDREFALAEDPSGEVARARLALVYGQAATDFFFGLLNQTLAVKTKYIHDQPELQAAVLAAGQGRIAYDPLRQELSYLGEMTVATRNALQALAGMPAAFAPAVGKLYTLNQAAVDPFRQQYPELMAEYAIFVASADPVETKRSTLLAHLLPELRTRRRRQQALAAASAAGGIEATLAQAIMADPTVLHAVGTAAADTTRPALDDFTALERGGLSARFFWSNTATGTPNATRDDPSIDYSATGANRLPANPAPGAPISGIWSGHLEVPDTGDYSLVIDTDTGATVKLSVAGKAVPLQQNGARWTTQTPVSLTGATLVPVAVTVERVTSTLQLRWQNSGAALQVPPVELTYPETLVEKLRASYTRTLKLASLGGGLGLTPAELAYLARLPTHRIAGDGWTNALPVSGAPTAATAVALFGVLTATTDFARLKAELAPEDERLLEALRAVADGAANGRTLLLDLTGWQQVSLDALLGRMNLGLGGLAQVGNLWRVQEAYSLVKTAGMSGPAFVAAVTNNPDNDTVRDLLSALRARYDSAAWNEVLRPINDELRARQRDALVAYILEKFGEGTTAKHIDTPEKLFEYFLMDVQMEPVMQTSRIRHALSSVQLFIERCLLNLETKVPPERIDADRWAWMKRYRVWEANRKVFLWPENWLEPELRDDQSPFFKETMSELLQKDITEDTADAALLNYLTRLEEVAKLEPCGMYFIAGTNQSDPITHVVARSAGAHRKYFHRKREGLDWSPWTPIKLDIEDNPVVPVVWKGRLLLFWLKIMKQGQLTGSKPGTANQTLSSVTSSQISLDATRTTIQAVLCWSEYYNGKWQGVRTSDVEHPAELCMVPADPANGGFDRSTVLLYSAEDQDTLRLFASASGGTTSFRLYNTHSLPQVESVTFFEVPMPYRVVWERNGRLQAMYGSLSTQSWWEYFFGSNTVTRADVIERRGSSPLSIVAPTHTGIAGEWVSPFFVADGRHAFCVATEVTGIRGASPYTNVVDITRLRLDEVVVERAPHVPPRFTEAMRHQPFFGAIDPAPMKLFVSEDANIHGGLASPGVVRFDGLNIGPAGALRNGRGNGR